MVIRIRAAKLMVKIAVVIPFLLLLACGEKEKLSETDGLLDDIENYYVNAEKYRTALSKLDSLGEITGTKHMRLRGRAYAEYAVFCNNLISVVNHISNIGSHRLFESIDNKEIRIYKSFMGGMHFWGAGDRNKSQKYFSDFLKQTKIDPRLTSLARLFLYSLQDKKNDPKSVKNIFRGFEGKDFNILAGFADRIALLQENGELSGGAEPQAITVADKSYKGLENESIVNWISWLISRNQLKDGYESLKSYQYDQPFWKEPFTAEDGGEYYIDYYLDHYLSVESKLFRKLAEEELLAALDHEQDSKYQHFILFDLGNMDFNFGDFEGAGEYLLRCEEAVAGLKAESAEDFDTQYISILSGILMGAIDSSRMHESPRLSDDVSHLLESVYRISVKGKSHAINGTEIGFIKNLAAQIDMRNLSPSGSVDETLMEELCIQSAKILNNLEEYNAAEGVLNYLNYLDAGFIIGKVPLDVLMQYILAYQSPLKHGLDIEICTKIHEEYPEIWAIRDNLQKMHAKKSMP